MDSAKFWGFVRMHDIPQCKIIATKPSITFAEVYYRHARDGWEFFAMSPSYDVVEDILIKWTRECMKEEGAEHDEKH